MQMPFPVGGNAPTRARRRLIERMMKRRLQTRPFEEFVRPVVVEPVLARFVARKYRMSRLLGVSRRVL
jgi:hypothetical protein